MYVEDIITDFARRINNPRDDLGKVLAADSWTRKFVASLEQSVSAGRALSSRQAEVFIKILKDVRPSIKETVAGLENDLFDYFLKSPVYRQQPYQSTPMRKEVRYLGDNKLGFRCKRADDIMHDIKNLANRGTESCWKQHQRPVFDRQHRLWVVSVNRDTLKPIMNIISNHNFAFDDAVAEFLTLASNSANETSTFMLDPTTGNIVANITDNPILESWIKYVLYGDVL